MYQYQNIGTSSLTDDPGREELLDSFPLFLLPLPCTGDATALRLPDGGLLAERGWDEVGGREPGNKYRLKLQFPSPISLCAKLYNSKSRPQRWALL